jgi:hypothetical protein
MLTFKEYIEKREELDESLLDAGKSVGRFVGGFGGNLLGQSTRGLWNLGKGASKVGLGTLGTAANVVTGTAQAAIGDKERFLRSLGRAGKGISTVGSGIVDAGKGAVQLAGAATGITPFLRGVQASSEEGIHPFSKDRNQAQQLFGFNANKPEPEQEQEREIKRSSIPRPKRGEVFFLSPITNSKNVVNYIDEVYKEEKEGKKLVTYDAKEFIGNVLVSYSNCRNKNPKTDKKLDYILKEYFPEYKIIRMKTFEGLGIKMDSGSILRIKNFINSIILLEIESKEEVTYLPEDPVRFRKDLIELHNNVLNTNNFSKNLSSEIKDLKKQVVRILNHYYPEKEVKIEVRKTS